MWKSKKFLIIGTIVAVVAVVVIAGVVLAQTSGTSTTSGKTFTARVAAILGIEEQTVKDAFTQAQREMTDEAIDARLKEMVDNGKMTQEQADKYKSWWQSRPDTLLPGDRFLGRQGMRGFSSGMGWCPPIAPSTPSTN
jgi:hypothetical protein